MGAVVLSLERLVCDLVSREPGLASAYGRELQAFDLLAQRLQGASNCLGLIGGALASGRALPPSSDLAQALPLASQRTTLLGEGTSGDPMDGSLELF
jgi:hypothetical protein